VRGPIRAQVVELAVKYFSASGDPLGDLPPHVVRLLEEEGLLSGGRLVIRRSRLIVKALEEGARLDLNKLSRYLSWQEFEDVVKEVFQRMGYRVISRRRFRHFEVDLMAYRRGITFVVEVKRWRYGGSRWSSVVRGHLAKVEYLVRNRLVPSLGSPTYVIPIIISLTTAVSSVVDGVPIVDAFRLVEFLREFESHLEELRTYLIP